MPDFTHLKSISAYDLISRLYGPEIHLMIETYSKQFRDFEEYFPKHVLECTREDIAEHGFKGLVWRELGEFMNEYFHGNYTFEK